MEIKNKVAESGIITINLENFLPREEALVFDIKNFLFMEMILKEKDFREALKTADYSAFADKDVAVFCSTDAIIPVWAYALTTVYLRPVARSVSYGTEEAVRNAMIAANIRGQIDPETYAGARVVLKGCGDVAVPPVAYITAAGLLQPVVQSLMFGEPCSTVPLYKKKAVSGAG